jgi:predicted lipoprotein with Yx(FWY)xxD motif
MIRLLVSLHRVALVAAIALALVVTGYGHRMPTAAEDEALAYALQNGISLNDLCGSDLGQSAHPGSDCQACQITCAAQLPPLTGARIDVELAFHAAVVAPLEVLGTAREQDPAHRPQGPPVA